MLKQQQLQNSVRRHNILHKTVILILNSRSEHIFFIAENISAIRFKMLQRRRIYTVSNTLRQFTFRKTFIRNEEEFVVLWCVRRTSSLPINLFCSSYKLGIIWYRSKQKFSWISQPYVSYWLIDIFQTILFAENKLPVSHHIEFTPAHWSLAFSCLTIR